MFTLKRDRLPTAETALKGRDEPIVISGKHYVLEASMLAPYPEGSEQLLVGIGCFWGAEKCFWLVDGVITTAVGYSAGITHNPSYDEVCSGNTAHNEVVLIVYDPSQVSTEDLLKVFWESHNPTQGMRQGNDRGTQ
jgi:peptide-methionine (S)-S-oxide reductase